MNMPNNPMSKDDQENTTSVFGVARYDYGDYRGMLFEFRINKDSGQVMGGVKKHGKRKSRNIPLIYPIRSIFKEDLDERLFYLIESAWLSTTSKLYLLLDKGHFNSNLELPHSLDGLIFDPVSKKLTSFPRPIQSKPYGHLISAYGKIYCIAGPKCPPYIPTASFERFDPNTAGSSEVLPSCEFFKFEDWKCLYITGYAVCWGCILFNLLGSKENQREVILFHVERQTWHRLKMWKRNPIFNRFSFRGRAVVVNKVIYALVDNVRDVIIAFNLRLKPKIAKNGSLKFVYYMNYVKLLQIPIPDRVIAPPPDPMMMMMMSSYMVHLGGLKFCLVRTGTNTKATNLQLCSITTFEVVVKEEKPVEIQTMDSCFRYLSPPERVGVIITFCFTPNHDEVETEENKIEIVRNLTKQLNHFKVQVLHAGVTKKNAFKALIAAEYTGVKVELKNFEIGSYKGLDFLEINPNGKVPVLETPDDGLITESNDIARYGVCLNFRSSWNILRVMIIKGKIRIGPIIQIIIHRSPKKNHVSLRSYFYKL